MTETLQLSNVLALMGVSQTEIWKYFNKWKYRTDIKLIFQVTALIGFDFHNNFLKF